MRRTKEQFESLRKESRQRILDAALKVFAKQGYHSATVDAIAKTAGISKGMMYNYFKSKDEVLNDIDFSLELLDLIHRIYEAGDSFGALDFMVKTRLFVSHIVIQICLGTLLPILLLAATQVVRFSDVMRRRIYGAAGILTLIGIFAMRWNVVIGGQLFSKSLLGYTTYKMEFATRVGLLPAIIIMVLPFVILAVLLRVLPPWGDEAQLAKNKA